MTICPVIIEIFQHWSSNVELSYFFTELPQFFFFFFLFANFPISQNTPQQATDTICGVKLRRRWEIAEPEFFPVNNTRASYPSLKMHVLRLHHHKLYRGYCCEKLNLHLLHYDGVPPSVMIEKWILRNVMFTSPITAITLHLPALVCDWSEIRKLHWQNKVKCTLLLSA